MTASTLLCPPPAGQQAERERIVDEIVALLLSPPVLCALPQEHSPNVSVTRLGHEREIERLWQECDALAAAGSAGEGAGR